MVQGCHQFGDIFCCRYCLQTRNIVFVIGCATVASLLHAKGSQLEINKRPRNQIPRTKQSHSPFSSPNGELWAKDRFSSQLDESLGRRPLSVAMTVIEIHVPQKLLPSSAG